MRYENYRRVHPEDKCKKEWMISRLSLLNEGLVIRYDRAPPAEIEFSPLTHHLIVFVLSNERHQITRMNGQEYDGAMHKGEFCLQPANVPAFYRWKTTDEILLFVIEPLFLSKIAAETGYMNPDLIEVRSLVKTRDRKIENLAYSFLKEIQTESIGSKLYRESLANLFGIHLLRKYCNLEAKIQFFAGGLSPYQLRQVIDYIQAHLSEEIGLKPMADLIGISQCHFLREFKKTVGLTPHKYIMQERVKMAKRLLKKQQNLPLAEVALTCGFSNQSHLGRVFKQQTNMTPKIYQKQA
ncbi:MAG: AraC family transcriptional regulator [Prochloraceae cyanobacterium]|nr:AraC family transcriptional regulator [Prochloraceae cyanobacterium]